MSFHDVDKCNVRNGLVSFEYVIDLIDRFSSKFGGNKHHACSTCSGGVGDEISVSCDTDNLDGEWRGIGRWQWRG